MRASVQSTVPRTEGRIPVKPPKINYWLRGRIWWYHLTINHKRHRASTGESDYKNACRVAERERAILLRHQSEAADPYRMSARELFDWQKERMEKSGRARTTIANHQNFADRYIEHFGDRPLTELSRFDVEGWRDWLATQKIRNSNRNGQALSPKTISEHLNWLSAIYNDVLDDLPNPVKRVIRPKQTHSEHVEAMQFYTPDEINKLIDTAQKLVGEDPASKEFRYWDQLHCWLILLSHTGMRIGEAQDLRFKDVDKRRKTVSVTSQKTGKRRTLNLTNLKIQGMGYTPYYALQDLMMYAENHYGETLDKDCRIYIKYHTWFFKTLRRLCRKAEVEFKGVHALRNSFATMALTRWTVAEVSHYLGHKDISTTFTIYGHLISEPTKEFSYSK